MKEGKKEGKLEAARELIKRGVHKDIISLATGFTREEWHSGQANFNQQ